MNHIENYNRLIANRDAEGTFFVRVDYMTSGNKTNFYVNENYSFTVEKVILYRMEKGIVYTIVVENVGYKTIKGPILLYSGNSGVFMKQQPIKLNITGCAAEVKTLKPTQRQEFYFLVKDITEEKEAQTLIKDLTDGTVYGYKLSSVFERFGKELIDNKDLFLEGMKHNPAVIDFASEELQLDPELLAYI